MKFFYAIALATALMFDHTANAQGSESRLIASSLRDYNNGVSFDLTDTAHYYYSNDRGGDQLLTMKYDSGYSWKYPLSVITEDKRTYREFNLDDNIIVSLEQSWNTGTSQWEDFAQDNYDYGTGLLPLVHVRSLWNFGTSAWDSSAKTAYTYDVDGNTLTRNTYVWNSGTNSWDNGEQHTYTYNIDNNETSYTYQSWDGSMWQNETRKSKTYTNNDMVLDVWEEWSTTLNNWENEMQFLYNYDVNHHLLTRTDQQWLTGSWVNYQLVTYTYTSDDPTFVEQQVWNTGTNSWDNSARSYNTFDGNHNITEGIGKLWNGFNDFENSTRSLREYNSYSQLTFLTMQNWDGAAWIPYPFDQEFRYYYEEFTPAPANILSAAKNGTSITLYPVPVQNSLTLQIRSIEQQSFSISILDMQGRLIKSIGKKVNNGIESIPISDLPAGNYNLKIAGNKNEVHNRTFTIVH